MTVLEFGPGEGWYTELLAPALAKKGTYYATTNDPNGPPESRATFDGQRFAAFLDEVAGGLRQGAGGRRGRQGPEALEHRRRHARHGDRDARAPRHEERQDARRVARRDPSRSEAGRRPRHRAAPRQARRRSRTESAKKGYLPETWVIDTVEAAGFKLAGKSEINANPKDTKDYAEGVWTLPPTFTLKDKDHDKYAAIGESDRMTLKFVKVAPKK